MMNKILLIIYLFMGGIAFPQETLYPSHSLQQYSYSSLYDSITSSKGDSVIREIYLDAYLHKAQAEDSLERIIQGYKNYLHYSYKDVRLAYGDSIIGTAKAANNTKLIGSAYLTKGMVYYKFKKYREALDHYLIADRYIVQTDDDYLKYKLKYNMALVKHDSRHYGEAISLLTECLEYFKKDEEHPWPYLNTLHLISRCHIRMKNYGLSIEATRLGISEGRRLGDTSREVYFVQTEGMNHCLRSNHVLAIEKLDNSLKVIRKEKDDFANVVLGYFYLGKSYWSLGDREKAVEYFIRVDTSFTAKDYIKHEYLEGYKLLETYYESNKNLELRLHYLERRIQAMEFLDRQQQYLDGKVKNQYDIKGVQRKKKKVESLLQVKTKRATLGFVLSGVLCVLIAGLIYRNFRIKRIYKQRFDAFMKGHRPANQTAKRKNPPIEKPDISQDMIDKVLSQLDVFEKRKKFLDKKMNAGKLAATIEVNNKYLPQIVGYYKKKKVKEYINDLRIDYILDLIEKDRRLVDYSNESLAGDAGFNSERAFSNAFKSRVGMSPTFFMREMRKENK